VSGQHRVLVIGGGFAGLQAVRSLRSADVEVTLVDRRNYHLFQPLLYQVATGALSPGEIGVPLRTVLARQQNVQVVMAEVAEIDLRRRRVRLCVQADGGEGRELSYDSLIVAAGAMHSYFGHDAWAPHAPGLKTIEDALEVRRRILTAFEAAEIQSSAERRRPWLTFAVVGAGPTGVELAGQIGEIARDTLRHEFRAIRSDEPAILLIEASDRVLGGYDPHLSRTATRALQRLGVTPMLGTMVTDVTHGSIRLTSPTGQPSEVRTRTVLWAAGVAASPLARVLAEASGAELDRAGRILVRPDLTLPGFPEVFAIGDMARVSDGHGATRPIPGVAPAAMQEGHYVARTIRQRMAGIATPAFTYRDKGSLATIGRRAAVVQIRRARLSGLPAWLAWLLIHLYYLTGLQNRLVVLVRWTVSFLTRGRTARLIFLPTVQAPAAWPDTADMDVASTPPRPAASSHAARMP
jgi:NADH:ubiquinone reductase (H+-translocating)